MAALAAIAVFLILEVTDVVDGHWRAELADGIENVAFPSWNLWVSGLAGAALGVLGLALIGAQVAPPKKGSNKMHQVYRGHDGETSIRGRAAINAARHELEQIDGVVQVDARVHRKRMVVELKIDDRANVAAVEAEARERLDHEFWINLGLADLGLNILVTHHPRPPRVR
jgi:hypothetical protein